MGRYLSPSKPTQRYKKTSSFYYQQYKDDFLKELSKLTRPYKIGFKFSRDSKRRFDYVNPLQTVQDMMVAHGWLEDDNADVIIPYFLPFEYNKEEPGVLILTREKA